MGLAYSLEVIDIFPFPLLSFMAGFFGRSGGGLADARAGNRQVRLWVGVSCELGGGTEFYVIVSLKYYFILRGTLCRMEF